MTAHFCEYLEIAWMDRKPYRHHFCAMPPYLFHRSFKLTFGFHQNPNVNQKYTTLPNKGL
jgi:hypothetical protein